jgi:hypothetical protein
MTPLLNRSAAISLITIVTMMTIGVIFVQSSRHEGWHQCIRSISTHERQAVMGSKVLFLGNGPFRQSTARANPKLMILPGSEPGECLIELRSIV